MEEQYKKLFHVYKSKPPIDYEVAAEETKVALGPRDFKFEYESFVPYPVATNKDFNKIIYKKQEFNRNKSKIDFNQDYDEIVDDRCRGEFKSSPAQKLLKNFMSPMTPYRSLLMYWGVGCGKTLSAVNIAEQYYDTFERRVVVVLSDNIKDNFIKQIYDINKVNQGTGTKYPDMVLNKQLLTKDLLEAKINEIIKKRYEFMGYKKLAIYMETLKKQIKEQIRDPVDPSRLPEIELRRKNQYYEILRDRFSNRLMIIDEAHNLRLPSEEGKKQISTAFLEFMGIVENVKLVLMTATPMYNIADEIVWMMNLMLTNDRAKTIKRADLFDKESNLTPNGKIILKEASRGYVSYMRGENPYSFPFRLVRSDTDPKDPRILKIYPTKDIYGEIIPDELKIKFLEILTSNMSDYQYEVYNSFKKKIKKDSVFEEELPVDAPEEAGEDETNDVQNTMQISNIVYPCDKTAWHANARLTYGRVGFNNCFQKKI